MSLVRLLTAGKTLVGLKDVSRRYRMSRPGVMPKFGSAQNPFHTTTDAAPATAAVQEKDAPRRLREPASNPQPQPPALSAAAAPAVAEVPGAAQIDSAPAPCAPAVPALAEVRPANNTVESAVVRSMGARIGRTNGLFTGFGWIRQWFSGWVAMVLPARRSALPVTPQALHLPRQAELSLDEVRVVRNDLSDADLEVVPMRLFRGPGRARPQAPQTPAAPTVAPGSPSVRPSAAPSAPAGTAWSRVSAQLFGAGRT